MREVSTQKLVLKLSELLKKNENIKPPEWSKYVKSGACSERPPTQLDWWYLRSAAILRRIYNTGPVGVQRLRTVFGGRRRRGYKPAKQMKAGGKVIRLMLQQLESAGYLKKVEKPRKGRIVTPQGQKLISKAVRELK
jgi:small subunit ribosomal protein S19e